MSRLPAVLVLGLLVTSVVRADVPPPKGQKRITVDHKIATDKEYSDYQFFTLIGGGKAGTLTAVKLDPKTPVVIAGAGRGGVGGRFASFVAVPKAAATKYGSEKEFHAAIKDGKVDGLVKANRNFASFNVVKDSDTRTTIVLEYTLDKIDAKDGIVLTAKGEDTPRKEPSPEESDSPDTDAAIPTVVAPRGGIWIAGLAGSAGLVLGGLWLLGRSRRGRDVGT